MRPQLLPPMLLAPWKARFSLLFATLLRLLLHRSAVPMFVLLGTFWPASHALLPSALMYQKLLTLLRTQWLQPLAGGNGHHVPGLLLRLCRRTLLTQLPAGTEETVFESHGLVLALGLLLHTELLLELTDLFGNHLHRGKMLATHGSTRTLLDHPLLCVPTMKPPLIGVQHLVPPLRMLDLTNETRALALLLTL